MPELLGFTLQLQAFILFAGGISFAKKMYRNKNDHRDASRSDRDRSCLSMTNIAVVFLGLYPFGDPQRRFPK